MHMFQRNVRNEFSRLREIRLIRDMAHTSIIAEIAFLIGQEIVDFGENLLPRLHIEEGFLECGENGLDAVSDFDPKGRDVVCAHLCFAGLCGFWIFPY